MAMVDPHERERVVLDIADDERPLLDPVRLAEARQMAQRGERPISVWGEPMSYGMYALAREGLLLRLAEVGGCGDVPESMIRGIASWSDDDLRAWLTRWAREVAAWLRAKPLPPRGQA